MINPNLSVVAPGRMIRKRDPLTRVPGPRGLPEGMAGDLSAPRGARAPLRSLPIGLGKARMQ